MKRILSVVLFIIISSISAFAQTNSKHVRVNGYYKSNGTYVQPHYRTAPNSTNTDNFSTLGNTNPYTGQSGYIIPDSKPVYSPNTSIYNSTLPSTTNNIGIIPDITIGKAYDEFLYEKNSYKDPIGEMLYNAYKDKPSYVTKKSANLRQFMGTSSAIITTLPANAEVQVINSMFGDWWEVYFFGKVGYMHSSLLKRP